MELPHTKDDFFAIRVDLLWSSDLADRQCINLLIRHMLAENRTKTEIECLNEYRESVKQQGLTDSEYRNLRKKKGLVEYSEDDLKLGGYYLVSGASFESGTRRCVHLDQPCTINHSEPHQREFFFKLFPYRFKQIPAQQKQEFLNFHLIETFAKNPREFHKFLIEVKSEASHVIGDGMELLEYWIDNSLKQEMDKEPPLDASKSAETLEFLTEDGKRVLPALQQRYSKVKPKFIYLLFRSMQKLNLVLPGADASESVLHRILINKFTSTGSRQNLGNNMRNGYSEKELENFILFIKSELERK